MSMEGLGLTGDIYADGIERCNHPLSRGRKCCHVKGHGRRHSHTWHLGDARYEHIGNCLLDMETGEVIGQWLDGVSRISAEVKQSRRAREDALRALWNHLPGFTVPQGPLSALRWEDVEGAPMDINFHYHGESGWSYGTDTNGHDVSVSPGGKVERVYSVNQRQEAVSCARRFGAAKASRKFDIPVKTIRTWVNRGE
jgi:hypothetical protein